MIHRHYGDEDDASLGRVFAQEVHSVFERNRSAVSMRVDYLPETLDAAIFGTSIIISNYHMF